MILTIAIPTHDSLKAHTVSSLFRAIPTLDCRVRLDIHTGCYVHDARNKLVDKAIRSGCTHILFIDSDMQFEEDAINKLIAHKKEIVGGLYYKRQLPKTPNFMIEQDGKLLIPDEIPESITKVFMVGTGFMLIDLKVFEKITPPWFFFGVVNNKMLGEDTFFCYQAKKAGIDVWLDPNIKLSHIGDYAY